MAAVLITGISLVYVCFRFELLNGFPVVSSSLHMYYALSSLLISKKSEKSTKVKSKFY